MKDTDRSFYKELLKPDTMIRLYAKGAFPMADEQTGVVSWYMPDVRAIIPLDNFNIPRSLKKIITKENFEIRFDTDFLSVIRGCADRENTWISDELIDAYRRLLKRGYIHTVETWKNDVLVGGLYGVAFRGAFFGESMYSRVSQASKAALMSLIYRLRDNGFVLLDVQYMNDHLKMFGAVEIGFDEFNKLLEEAYGRSCLF